jgi:stage V sporulation protein B
MKQSSVMKNAIILFTAMAITKLIGAFLKIPLTNILGGLGMGYFSTAYSLFAPVYAVTAAALPTVIMRMTARHNANNANNSTADSRKILHAGLVVAFAAGLAGSIGILAIAAPFSIYVAGSPSSLPSMLVIAPSLLIGSIAAVYRGYYEGMSNMLPTAISQIIEAVVKAGIGIFLAIALIPYGIAYAAAGAIAAITVAELFGLIFLYIRSKFDKLQLSQSQSSQSQSQSANMRLQIRCILRESLPITLAALAMNLNPFIDLLTIPNIINSLKLPHDGNFIYGSYTGIAIPIFAIATAVTAMIGKSALPEITKAWESRNITQLTRTLRILFKGTFMAGLPVCIGLAALSKPILSLLFPARPAEVAVSATPLIALGLGGVSLILAGTLFGIFLAMGRVDLQIKLMLTGAALKLAGNLVLIRIEWLNVTGAAISTIICYSIISIIGLIMLKNLIKENLGIAPNIFRPLFFSLLCGITAYVCYYHTFADVGYSQLLRLAVSIAAGALAYLIPTMFSDRKHIKSLFSHNKNARTSPKLRINANR